MSAAVHFERVLMCAPTAYALKYEINPWMSLQNTPDIPLAQQQWSGLYTLLTEQIGASVELIAQADDAPDMVFTANAGLVRDDVCLLSNFRHPERGVEEPHFREWFESRGFTVKSLPNECNFEGEGDALFVGNTLVAGYLKRSDICSHRWAAEQLGIQVLSLELVDSRWYHLDTCFLPLTSDTVAFYPGAFDSYAQNVIRNNFMTMEVKAEEALRFACNAVVIGTDVAIPAGCPQTARTLLDRGYNVFPVDLSEFLKAGGAAKCLTLQLNGSGDHPSRRAPGCV